MAKTETIKHPGAEVAAVAAVASAAAVGGKLVRDRRTQRIDAERAYRLRSEEAVPDGIRRIARAQLESQHEAALESLRRGGATEAVQADLERSRARVAAWTFETGDFGALEPGLRRIYRRGRKAMQAAAAEQSSENLHEWRKRVKDLWHATQILRPASPKRMRKLSNRLHDLSD